MPQDPQPLHDEDDFPTGGASGLTRELLARLATGTRRTEADIQSDIKALLLTADLGLGEDQVELEQQIGDGTKRRIDIAVGRTIIETKRDFELVDLDTAERQLAGYLQVRERNRGVEYIGILTDGRTWRLYDLRGTDAAMDDAPPLRLISERVLKTTVEDAERHLIWLESAMSTRTAIAPTPAEIDARLGADSAAHRIDISRLADLYHSAPNPAETEIKRGLWAKLLRTSFGEGFTDDEALFLNHTLLVIQAEIIAHAALGFDISPTGGIEPADLVSGEQFARSLVYGVIEQDFFDWVTEVPGGAAFIAEQARRLSRFTWEGVENDVLKILYESVIPVAERERLGEYYTPDWLAHRIVADTVTEPLTARVADPSCGSGTFLFHAVRAYLDAAEAAGASPGAAAMEVCSHVVGMDIHPVSVTLARVTYLLAIGRERLTHADRGELRVPVWLGDSIQWEQRTDTLSEDGRITVSTGGDHFGEDAGGSLFGDLAPQLVFPSSLLRDAGVFDRVVSEMADAAVDDSNFKSMKKGPSTTFEKPARKIVKEILERAEVGIPERERKVLRDTLDTLRRLVNDGRDHIWGYYVRNLIRPLWLRQPENRVTHLVGNPPWVRFSKMLSGMQANYRNLAEASGILATGASVTAMDLSTLFVARVTELYLAPGGAAAFVMPHGTMSRVHAAGFRDGYWAQGTAAVRFRESWDLQDATTGFPMASCVIRFTRATRDEAARSMSESVLHWDVRLDRADVPWAVARASTTTTPSTVRQLQPGAIGESPYRGNFRQGATIVPRMLFFVDEGPVESNPLGTGAGRVHVISNRTNKEKAPWRDIDSLDLYISPDVLHSIHLGETLLPFRTCTPKTAILPVTDGELLDEAEIARHRGGLADWWKTASAIWEENKSANSRLSLMAQLNYTRKLSTQLPTSKFRIIYSGTGSNLTAAVVDDPRCLFWHTLYWAPVATRAEGDYLAAIFNSPVLLDLVRPLQTVGLFGPRHFDKHIFDIPIPLFDEDDGLHRNLAELGARAAEFAATVDTGQLKFQGARKRIRKALDAEGITAEIDAAIRELIPSAAVEEMAEIHAAEQQA